MKKILVIMIFIAICCFELTADLNEGLVAHYPFNGNANDESGNGNNGTIYGATLATDRFGNANRAYGFDGIDDWINVIDDSSLDLQEFSLASWVRMNIIDGQQAILARGESFDTDIMQYSMGVENDSIRSWFEAINDDDYRIYSENVSPQVWYFVTTVRNIDGNFLLYINSQLVAIQNNTPVPGSISVVYCPPAPPDSVQLTLNYPDVTISWTEVDTTICGSSITPDLYVVQYSEVAQDSAFYYLNYVIQPDTSYIHTGVLQYGNNGEPSDHMFYKVIAIKNYSREQIEYLEELNNSHKRIKWSYAKRNLEVFE